MAEWRAGPLVLGFEVRQLQTEYAAGEFVATHLNLAAGWRF